NQFAGHSRELEQPFRVAFEQLADYSFDIAARAEAATASGNYDHSYGIDRLKRLKRAGQLSIHFEGQRVQPVGAIQSYQRDRAPLLIKEALRSYVVRGRDHCESP